MITILNTCFAIGFVSIVFYLLLRIGRKKGKVVKMELDEFENEISK